MTEGQRSKFNLERPQQPKKQVCQTFWSTTHYKKFNFFENTWLNGHTLENKIRMRCIYTKVPAFYEKGLRCATFLFQTEFLSRTEQYILCTLSFRPLDKCTVITLIQYEKFQSVFCNFIVWLTLLSLYTNIVKSYNLLSNSCPELSNQLLSFSASQIY